MNNDSATETDQQIVPLATESEMLGLLEVAAMIQEQVDSALESVGLSGPKYRTLEQLLRADEPMSLSALADCRKCVRSNITQLVDRLAADGLVERVDDPSDRRAVRARVTESGRQRFEAGTKAIASVRSQLANRVSAADRDHFLRVLSAFRGQ